MQNQFVESTQINNQFMISTLQPIHKPNKNHFDQNVNKSQQWNNKAIQNIFKAIQNDQLVISDHQTPLQLKPAKNHTNHPRQIQKQRNEILNKKAQMMNDLKNLEEMQKSIMKQSRIHENKHRLSMSRFNACDKKIVQSLQKQRRKHQQFVQDKINQYEQNLLKIKQQQKNKKLKKMEQQKQQRKFQATQNISKIKARHQERSQAISEQNKNIQKLKSQQKLFRKIQNISALRMKKEEQDWNIKHESYLKNRNKSMSMSDVKQHQVNYIKKRDQQAQNRKARLEAQFKKQTKKHKLRFLQGGLQYQNTRKKEDSDKWNDMLARVQTNWVYSEQVRKDAKKYIKITEQSRLIIKGNQVKDGLQIHQRYQQGNQFMKLGNKFATQASQTRTSQKKSKHNSTLCLPQIEKQQKQSQKNPKDYLKQLKMKRKVISPSERLSKCLQSGEFLKAVTLVNESSHKKGDYKSQFSSAKAKLRILQAIQNTR